ncbi:MAG: hypothetical protein M3Q75_14265 [Gemmatimonadota bacterium]|nr:hypothetical protein [Gemmatimonadota bacterium]
MTNKLEGLLRVRAERALLAAKAAAWDEGWELALDHWYTPVDQLPSNPYIAALRASQGDSDA